jgi:ABC-type nitrate/sulfonate/bicarbonate transport system substrate-binding protein
LNCFTASDWGVPGNPDQLGFAVDTKWEASANHRQLLQKFITATVKGYQYALANPSKASDILVSQASTANLSLALVKASMETIIDNKYWTSSGATPFGSTDTAQGQQYLDFLAGNEVYKNNYKPDASQLATNEYAAAHNAQ